MPSESSGQRYSMTKRPCHPIKRRLFPCTLELNSIQHSLCSAAADARNSWLSHPFVHTQKLANLRMSSPQKHFLWTMVGPDSSYSPFEIHICWKVLNDDRIDPPIHTEYFRSGGATTLIFIVDGARAVSSFVMRSPMPANIVVPPESTTFEYKSLRISTSHFMIDWKVVSWMPLASLPTKLGWNRTSGQRKRSLPTVMILPSGSSYVFSLSELSVAAFISVSKSNAM